MKNPPCIIHVAINAPVHIGLGHVLSYAADQPLPAGTLVRVPFGKREVLGVVWDTDARDETQDALLHDEKRLKPITCVLEGITPLDAHWRKLVAFAARYYQRSLGEIALNALPPNLKNISPEQLTRRLQRIGRAAKQAQHQEFTTEKVALNQDQISANAKISSENGPFLLFGSTGSGKTEVYLHAVEEVLLADPLAQALIMVPEINLTPQLEERFTRRFTPQLGVDAVVTMHSGMTHPQRLSSWIAAHSGKARIVLGTRMAIFASLPHLRMIVVDEEHDPSYKQQDGARYSARDLAVWRGREQGAKVILGSATPSLESWHASRPASADDQSSGRYLRISMPNRIGQAQLAKVRRVNMNHQPHRTVFSAPLLAAITERVQRGEQCMVLLNRRGYAPVLYCVHCGWKSGCPHCSAHQVFHKIDRTLRCHHCSTTQRVPSTCPGCGSSDILPIGRGTEQLQEELSYQLEGILRPDGSPICIARMDADTTKAKGALEEQLSLVHTGQVDVLVGTQMIAKGHDFRRITLVAAVEPDGALFSNDFRAPERLLALLMQAAGRAGRDATYMQNSPAQCEMWVQTWHPEHPVFEALRTHDYASFADQQLQERAEANMPPYAFHALTRADARTQEAAQRFLSAACAQAHSMSIEGLEHITLYPPIPLTIQRVANVERAQMLIESTNRGALQRFLKVWHTILQDTRSKPEHKGVIRWLMDVDPLEV